MDMYTKSPPQALAGATSTNTLEADARRENPEWFASKDDPLVNEAVLKSMNELPKDLAAKIRNTIDTSPPECVAPPPRPRVLRG